MKKTKRLVAQVCAITVAITIFIFAVPISAEALIINPTAKINDLIIKEFNKRECAFSRTLFNNAISDGKNVHYWQEDVPKQIKDGITNNGTFKTRLEYVISKARVNGKYKVDYISDSKNPSYNDPSFNETLKNQPIEFNSPADLSLSIHGVNGHMVIEVVNLGNNSFDIWVSLQDYYDFDLKLFDCYKDALVCAGNNFVALEQYMGKVKKFTVTLGFSYIITVDDPSSESPSRPTSPTQPAPSKPNPAPSQSTTKVTNRWYYKTDWISGTYNGDWKNNAPNGNGKLVYATSSKMYASSARYHEGTFVEGARVGWGTTYYDSSLNNGAKRYEGQWYGMFAKGRVVFDGKVYFDNGNVYKAVLTAKDAVNGEWTTWEIISNSTPEQPLYPSTPSQSPEPDELNVNSIPITVINDPDSACALVKWSALSDANKYVVYRERVSTGEITSYEYDNYRLDFLDAEAFYNDNNELDSQLGYGKYKYKLEAYNTEGQLIANSGWVEFDNSQETATIYIRYDEDGVILNWSVNGYEGFNLVAYEENGPGDNTHIWHKTPILADGKNEIRFKYSDFTPGLRYRFYIGAFSSGLVCVSNEVTYTAESQKHSIKLYIGLPGMDTENGRIPIDEYGTHPLIENNRTLLPIRAIVEALGGTVTWDEVDKKVTIRMGDKILEMWIDNKISNVNGSTKVMEVAPRIMKGRTMLPLRFVSENLNCDVDWDANNKKITVTSK